MGDAKSLAHTKWNCKYRMVFAPIIGNPVRIASNRKANVRSYMRLLGRCWQKALQAHMGTTAMLVGPFFTSLSKLN